MDLMMIVNSLFEGDDWHRFHDAIVEVTDVSHDKEKLKELFLQLPKTIQQTAFDWGLSDTVFGDEVFVYVTQQLTKNRQV